MSDTTHVSKSIPVAGVVVSGAVPSPLVPDLESFRAVREVLLQADPNNTDSIIIGNKTTRAIVLEPADTFVIPLENPGEIYHVAASGAQTLRYLGRD